jgi:hypothetical protein
LLSSRERSQRARIAAFAMHAEHDTKATTAAGRRAAEQRFRDKVISAAAAKGEELTEKEIERRASALRSAHMARLAFLSAKARRRAKRVPQEPAA